MSLSKEVIHTNDTKQISPSKGTSLNPNAAAFIPCALRSPSGSSSEATARFSTSGTSGKAVLDRSESSISHNSDDEAHQYWRHQLPDDITPDFKVMVEDETQGSTSLSLAGLSLHDGSELSSLSGSIGSGYIFSEQQDLSHHMNGNSFTDKYRYPPPIYGEDPTAVDFLHASNKPWDKQIVNSEQLIGSGMDGNLYNGFTNDVFGENAIVDEAEMNPLEFLASQFPGFAAESLTEVYFTNGCDLNLTIEMLTQLELQVDGAFSQNLNSKTFSAPSLTAMDFPALVPDGQNSQPKALHPYQSSDKDDTLLFKSNTPASRGGAPDFAAAVRKLASQNSGMWKYDRNGSSDVSIGSSRSSHVLASTYNNAGHGRGIYGDRLRNRGSARGAPVWLETGDAVANMYSGLREEARDHARLRNVYFEQARQAYLIGNKALAKELSVKGQLHNMEMKAAHEKAQESIYRQRNPGMQGPERMIDLHGLHVSEAIQVLKHELGVLRSTARAADQRLQVYICVGTGHHTRGSRTIARLPVAVERYLLEEEGLDYTEPQPGLLRVVIY